MTIKRGFSILVFCLSFILFNSLGQITPHPSTKLAREIRKLFLDIRGVPPSIKELEWYTSYALRGYETALDDLLNVKEKNDRIFYLKEYYLSKEYREQPSAKIEKSTLEKIIFWQSGIREGPIFKAKRKMVSDSLAIESDGGDAIDYIAENLMGRITNLEEANLLLNIRKKYPSDEEGLLAVIEAVLTFKDCLYK